MNKLHIKYAIVLAIGLPLVMTGLIFDQPFAASIATGALFLNMICYAVDYWRLRR